MENIVNFLAKSPHVNSSDNIVVKKLRDNLFKSSIIAKQSKSSNAKVEKVLRDVEKGINDLRKKLYAVGK